jgi:hypothetical protein
MNELQYRLVFEVHHLFRPESWQVLVVMDIQIPIPRYQ